MSDILWMMAWGLLMLAGFWTVLRHIFRQRHKEREWREHIIRRLRDD